MLSLWKNLNGNFRVVRILVVLHRKLNCVAYKTESVYYHNDMLVEWRDEHHGTR